MSDCDIFDLVVIGGGPGGYVAAIRCAQQGMKVACVDKALLPGGTCLREGCIPSKVLLESSGHFEQASEQLAQHGVIIEGPRLDLDRMMKRKEQTVHMLGKGVESLFRKHGVTFLHGEARLEKASTVSVLTQAGDSTRLEARRVLLALGSRPQQVPQVPMDGERIVSSSEALSWSTVPEHLIIIGGGYIGLELGSVWKRLGSQVTVVEAENRLFSHMDEGLAQEAQRLFSRQGIEMILGQKVLGASNLGHGCRVDLADGRQVMGSHVLVAVGRCPRSDGADLSAMGVKLDDRGRVEVNEQFETSVPGVYAIGDLIAGPMLAHKAEEEAVVLARQWQGESVVVHHDRIPSVVYTHPELASVGLSEQALVASGRAFKKGIFHFRANGRARAAAKVDGWVKTLADQATDEILGVHIIGEGAGELIHQAATAMHFKATLADLANICHAHPTYAEAVRESALAADGRAIHA